MSRQDYRYRLPEELLALIPLERVGDTRTCKHANFVLCEHWVHRGEFMDRLSADLRDFLMELAEEKQR